jgi:serine protease Do
MIALVGVAALLLVAAGAAAALLIVDDDDETSASTKNGSGKGHLGVTVTVTPPQGLRVASVEANGPAAQAGIQVGDFLRSVDGQIVRTPEQLRAAVEAISPGSLVSITYERGDRELQATVKLGEAPVNAQIEATPAPNAANPPNPGVAPNQANRGQLGVQIQNVTPQLKQRYNLSVDTGVVITLVQPNSAAAAAGLRAGDVVTSVGGRAVSNAEEATRLIGTAARGQPTSLGILRGGEQLSIQVTLASAQAVPGFDTLPPALQERLRELAQSGQYSLEQLQRLAAGQNNLVGGMVKSISATSITLTRLEGTGDVTFALNAQTQYRLGGNEVSPGEIRSGTTAFVISLDGQTAIGVFVLQR